MIGVLRISTSFEPFGAVRGIASAGESTSPTGRGARSTTMAAYAHRRDERPRMPGTVEHNAMIVATGNSDEGKRSLGSEQRHGVDHVVRYGRESCLHEPKESEMVMACRISELVLGCREPEVLGRFWCEVLDFVVLDRMDDGSLEIGPREGFGGPQPTIILGRRDEPEKGKPRLHIDVNATDRDQEAELERLLSLGARPADIGQTGARTMACPGRSGR